MSDFDVIVVGAGNAALAAVSAREQGAGRVLALEPAVSLSAVRVGDTIKHEDFGRLAGAQAAGE